METLYTSGPQTKRVGFVLALSVVAAVAGVWAGVDLGQTYGLRPADGGVLKPLPIRLAWAVGLSALGVGFFGGMVVYGRCYVTRLARDAEAGVLHVRTLLGRARTIPTADLLRGDYRAGRSGGRIAVNAPWLSLRVRGRRLPYVLDLQGEIPDLPALLRSLDGDRGSGRRP
jgi:hypothetical protein